MPDALWHDREEDDHPPGLRVEAGQGPGRERDRQQRDRARRVDHRHVGQERHALADRPAGQEVPGRGGGAADRQQVAADRARGELDIPARHDGRAEEADEDAGERRPADAIAEHDSRARRDEYRRRGDEHHARGDRRELHRGDPQAEVHGEQNPGQHRDAELCVLGKRVQHPGLDLHPHGDEEHWYEKIGDWLDTLLDVVSPLRGGEHQSGRERPDDRRQTDQVR